MFKFFSLVDSPVMKFNPTNREELNLSLRHVAIRAKHFSVILSFLENPTVIEAFHKLLFLTIVVSTVAFRHLESVIQQALRHLSRNSLNCPLCIPNLRPHPIYITLESACRGGLYYLGCTPGGWDLQCLWNNP